MKAAKEKEWCKMDIQIKEAFHPAWEDRYNRPTTARAEQPASYRPTTGPPSVIERSKADAAPVYRFLPKDRNNRHDHRYNRWPLRRPSPQASARPPSGTTAFQDRYFCHA